MPAIDGLSEVAGRAAQAESTARSVTWQDQDGIDAAATKVDKSLAQDRIALARPGLSAVAPSETWRGRLAELVDPDRDAADRSRHRRIRCSPPPRPRRTQTPPWRSPGLSLIEAHRAVLQARSAALRAGDSEAVAAAVRGYRFLPPGNTVVRHGQALGSGVTTEFSNVLRSRPRSILNKLAIGFVIGVAYLVFIWALDWDNNSELLPYFAIYALSGVIGGVVCTNALSWDAGRVRADLIGGRRLWHVLISKNWSMFVLVGTVGVVLSVLLAWPTGEVSTLVKALGELFTMMLIWLGIGNVLSVLSPLRVEPLKDRFHDGTLKPFLLSFAISYVVGLGVNLMLTWRVWAKRSMIEEMGGLWVPVLHADRQCLRRLPAAHGGGRQPGRPARIRRTLLREMIDYKAAKAGAVDAPASAEVPRARSAVGRLSRTSAMSARVSDADGQHQQVLPAAGLDRGGDRQGRGEPGKPVHQPVRRLLAVRRRSGSGRRPRGRPCARAGRRWSAAPPDRRRKAGPANGSPEWSRPSSCCRRDARGVPPPPLPLADFEAVKKLSMLGPRASFTDLSGSTGSSQIQHRQPSRAPTSSSPLTVRPHSAGSRRLCHDSLASSLTVRRYQRAARRRPCWNRGPSVTSDRMQA